MNDVDMSVVRQIAAAVREGRRDVAEALFRGAYAAVRDDAARTDLLVALGKTVQIPPDVILVAPMTRLTNNPLWHAIGWRCGPCTRAWIAEDAVPTAGNNYKSVPGAVRGARAHAKEHEGLRIVVSDDLP